MLEMSVPVSFLSFPPSAVEINHTPVLVRFLFTRKTTTLAIFIYRWRSFSIINCMGCNRKSIKMVCLCGIISQKRYRAMWLDAFGFLTHSDDVFTPQTLSRLDNSKTATASQYCRSCNTGVIIDYTKIYLARWLCSQFYVLLIQFELKKSEWACQISEKS